MEAAMGSKPVLLLRLEGPLQAWGTRSRWDVRDTGLEPTKSGVIGLLGCALGYPMYDRRLEQLDAKLRFGVRIEEQGTIATDYQTITDYLPTANGQYRMRGATLSLESILREGYPPATVISPRSYLEDAAFLVALERKDVSAVGATEDNILQRCADAVRKPHWPLYLGRKACVPTRPIFDSLDTCYSGVADALERHPWSVQGAAFQQRQLRNDLWAFVEDESGDLLRQDAMRINSARIYEFRSARHIRGIKPVEKGA
jgi:CRISPR system Cascade subunit CasD